MFWKQALLPSTAKRMKATLLGSLHEINLSLWTPWARSSVVGWSTMLQAGRLQDRVPMRWIFFNWPNPSSRTIALDSTQPLTKTSTRNLPEDGRVLPKSRLSFNGIYGVISHKVEHFITTAVRTSNPKRYYQNLVEICVVALWVVYLSTL
jgi:hypothetical protein